MSEDFYVIDEANYKYFSMTPHIIFEIGLKANEIALYMAIKRASGDKGKCTKSNSKLAKEAGISIKLLPSIRNKLSSINPIIKKPLIKCEHRISEFGDKDTCSLTIIDIWPETISFLEGSAKTPLPTAKKQVRQAKTQVGVAQKGREGRAKTPYKEEPFKNNLNEEEKKNTKKKVRTDLLDFGKYVKLSENEYKELCDKNGKAAIDDLISSMNDWIPNHRPQGYTDYAAALRTWIKRSEKNPPFAKGGVKNENVKEDIRRRQLAEYQSNNGSFDKGTHQF